MRGRFTALRLWWKEKKEREKDERMEGRKGAKEGRKREKGRGEGRGKEGLSGPCILKAFFKVLHCSHQGPS